MKTVFLFLRESDYLPHCRTSFQTGGPRAEKCYLDIKGDMGTNFVIKLSSMGEVLGSCLEGLRRIGLE